MEDSIYYDAGSILEYTGQGSAILTGYGADIWLSAIPGLNDRCPNLFMPSGEPSMPTPAPSTAPYAEELAGGGQAAHGNETWNIFTGFANSFGVSTQTIAGIFWLVAYAGCAGIMWARTRNLGASLGIPSILLLVGTQFGGIHMAYPLGALALTLLATIYIVAFRNA